VHKPHISLVGSEKDDKLRTNIITNEIDMYYLGSREESFKWFL